MWQGIWDLYELQAKDLENVEGTKRRTRKQKK
jgi:hypothetical protein